MISCDEIAALAGEQSLLGQCTMVNPRMVRLSTAFSYPNGDRIDLFLIGPEQPASDGTLHLTDYGETTSFLLDAGLAPWRTRARRQRIELICSSLGVVWEKGHLAMVVPGIGQLGDAMLRLAHCCVRVAELIWTARVEGAADLRDEVEEVIDRSDLEYQSDVELVETYQNRVMVDLRVAGATTESLVKTLQARHPSSASQAALYAFRTWYDLQAYRDQYLFVTVVAVDRGLADSDLHRLGELSQVFEFPAQRELFLEAVSA